MTRDQAIDELCCWITKRIREVAASKWADSITEWLECIEQHSIQAQAQRKGRAGPMISNHWQEPPFPLLLGYLAQVAADYGQVADPDSPGGATDLNTLAQVIQNTYGFPDPYKSCPHFNPHDYPQPTPLGTARGAPTKVRARSGSVKLAQDGQPPFGRPPKTPADRTQKTQRAGRGRRR